MQEIRTPLLISHVVHSNPFRKCIDVHNVGRSRSSIHNINIVLLILFQISVINVNDPPEGLIVLGAHSLPENLPTGSFAGDIHAIDQDTNDDHTFKLLAVAAG